VYAEAKMPLDDVIDTDGDAPLHFQASRPPTARLKSSRSRKAADAPTAWVPAALSESEGPFWFESAHNVLIDGKRVHRGISNRERQQLKELVKSDFFGEELLRGVVVKLNDESSEAPRLRAYDWAVTNYAKGHPMVMLVQGPDGRSAVVDPNLAYEGELRKHHRLLFDPFRRGTHVFFEIDGEIQRSTVGQLTFIRWCLENGVDKYVEANLPMIRNHMSSATKRGRAAESGEPSCRRRRELTKAPTRMVRGVLMTAFDITTDTEKELEASRTATRATQAAQLTRELAQCSDADGVDKARQIALLLHGAT